MLTFDTLSIPDKAPTAVAVGYFDGVHLGHRSVIAATLAEQANGLSACVFSFTMHTDSPAKKKGAGRLQSLSTKERTIAALGADQLMLPDFSLFMGLSPAEFAVEVLHKGLHAKVVCCGYDYHFGKGGVGDATLLQSLLAPYDIEVRQIPAVLDEGEPVSSTRIRTALESGKIETANRLLGRPFAIDFPVVHGQQLGHRLGFPTANQPFPTDFILPKFGVYATRVWVDGVPYVGATNVGRKPTVGSELVAAESFLLDWSGDLYGKSIETEFLAFLRPEEKFSSLEALSAAIGQNAAEAKKIVTL